MLVYQRVRLPINYKKGVDWDLFSPRIFNCDGCNHVSLFYDWDLLHPQPSLDTHIVMLLMLAKQKKSAPLKKTVDLEPVFWCFLPSSSWRIYSPPSVGWFFGCGFLLEILKKYESIHTWLVVDTKPLWKIMEWVSSSVMIFHSQLFLESHKTCSSHHQPDIFNYIMLYNYTIVG